MKETNTSNEIVIVLTEHPVLGILLIPYLIERPVGGDEIRLTEQAFHASDALLGNLTNGERKAIEIASFYTEKYLMQTYSNETTPARFYHKLSTDPNKIKNIIRPFINEKLVEMVKLIVAEGLPFFQKESRNKILYPHNAYRINRQPVETSFTFELEEDSFSYQLDCTCDNKTVALTEFKPVVVLTTTPATLLMGMELFTFHHIESARLIPFTKRKRITVDASLAQKYIDNVLIPIARHHSITTHGMDLMEKEYPCEPLLYVEEVKGNELLLRLVFKYGEQIISPTGTGDSMRFIPCKERTDENDAPYFRRDAAAEARIMELLTTMELDKVDESHFKQATTVIEKGFAAWVLLHKELLTKEFKLMNSFDNQPFCLD